jgi:hypothetical protein
MLQQYADAIIGWEEQIAELKKTRGKILSWVGFFLIITIFFIAASLSDTLHGKALYLFLGLIVLYVIVVALLVFLILKWSSEAGLLRRIIRNTESSYAREVEQLQDSLQEKNLQMAKLNKKVVTLWKKEKKKNN